MSKITAFALIFTLFSLFSIDNILGSLDDSESEFLIMDCLTPVSGGNPPELEFVKKIVGNNTASIKELNYTSCCNEGPPCWDSGSCGNPQREWHEKELRTYEIIAAAISKCGNYAVTVSKHMYRKIKEGFSKSTTSQELEKRNYLGGQYPLAQSETIKRWDLNTQECIKEMQVKWDFPIYNLQALKPEHMQLISDFPELFALMFNTNQDCRNICLLDNKENVTTFYVLDFLTNIVKLAHAYDNYPYIMVLSPDNKLAAYCSNSSPLIEVSKNNLMRMALTDIQLFKLSDGEIFKKFQHNSNNTRNKILRFSAQSDKLLSVNNDNTIFVFDFHSEQPIAQFKHNTYINSAFFSTDSNCVITLSPGNDMSNGCLYFWDIATQALKGKYVFVGSKVRDIVINYEKNLLAIVAERDTMYFYNILA